MKRLAFTGVLLVIMTMKGFSQIEKSTILIGGYANFTANENNTIFSLNPNSGLFLTDRFCLGVSLPIVYASDNLYWGLAPFGRYYFQPKESKSLYISGAIGITSFIKSEYTLTNRALTLGIGHVWLLNKSVGFEVEAQGNTSFHDIDFGIFLGFQIYFNKSKD
ncbi:MAG TPA: hypothetical protein VIH57_23500 [Bacteroidales bacterium]